MVSNVSDTEILYCNFNQDQGTPSDNSLLILKGCFAIGTQNGFKIYSTNPFKETFSRGTTSIGLFSLKISRLGRRNWNCRNAL